LKNRGRREAHPPEDKKSAKAEKQKIAYTGPTAAGAPVEQRPPGRIALELKTPLLEDQTSPASPQAEQRRSSIPRDHVPHGIVICAVNVKKKKADPAASRPGKKLQRNAPSRQPAAVLPFPPTKRTVQAAFFSLSQDARFGAPRARINYSAQDQPPE